MKLILYILFFFVIMKISNKKQHKQRNTKVGDVMLKDIPTNLSPKLFKIMMEMGHGDEIVLADGNFPASNLAKRLIRADGHNIPPLLESILKFFPLDTFVQAPVILMQTVKADDPKPPIWNTYKNIISEVNEEETTIMHLERFAFYERAKNVYAIVATSEIALYANIILKKGVIEN